ncbi:hypothetical protein [Streptomyces chilikensis]|uniref:Transmembrane protein n=1 Tax=Streptomyces chilikensis TaxID=1194079 RepID=A0ABV3ENQ8_9ACTN
MHMTSHPQQLRNEDRPDFARALDEALRSAPRNDGHAGPSGRPNGEQLRTLALEHADEILEAAAAEYDHYLDLREGLRRLADAGREPSPGTEGGTVPADADATGPGAVAVAVVLAPLLAGASAAVLLLIGSVLKMLTPEPAMAAALLTAGWTFGALAAAALLAAATGLLITAVRNGARAYHVETRTRPDADLERARQEWLDALRERGIRPFLAEAATRPPQVSPAAGGRPAELGNHDGHPGAGPHREPGRLTSPRFSSPGYSSPDFSSRNHRTD